MTKAFTSILLSILSLAGSTAWAQKSVTLFDTQSGASTRYRIPSIARLNDGTLMAFSDLRYGTGDIGNGYDTAQGIEVVGKSSSDNGSNWGTQQTVTSRSDNATDNDGSNGYNYAHGDAATVVDRESGKILMVTASGLHGFFSSSYKLQVARSISEDNGTNWSTSNISDQLYKNDTYVKHLFFSSGRMIQSTIVKKGDYYRIYAAVNTRIEANNTASNNGGSRVVYSDDFGATWNYLGGVSAMPVPYGDECKVEELPNGNILLSCRAYTNTTISNYSSTGYGRYYNIFSFTDRENATGSWGAVQRSGGSNVSGQVYGASCNGEILLVPAKRASDGKQMYVLLQSIPADANRNYVSIYWKALETEADYDNPSDFVSGWTKYQVSTTSSAYSTMVLDQNGDVAFFYEETSLNSGYDMVFKSLPLSTITSGAYSYSASPSGTYHTTSEPTIEASPAPVSAPKFSVNSGTFSVAQTVELTCDTEGATIYYTSDGSEPTAKSTRYTGAITISESTTLKAIAIDADGNSSTVITATYSIVPVDNFSKQGTKISLDYNSSHQLFSSGANGSDKDKQFFGFLRHDIAHVQLISSNTPDLNTEGAGIFVQNTNNMLFDASSHYLGFWNGTLDSGSRTQYCYLAIVAPKGYRFTRYEMEFDAANSTATNPTIEQYTYDADGNPVYSDDQLFTVSETNTSLDKSLDNASNVLYFRVDNHLTDKGYSLLLKSLQVTYVIDQPFQAQVPNSDGNLDVHTGLLDLGTFSYNGKGANYWSFDRDYVTDYQEVNVVSSTGEKQSEVVTVDGTEYFVAAANGDYYVEAPQKFRLTGAAFNFLRSDVEGNTTVVDYTSYTPSTSSSGDTIIIGTSNGNYLSISGTSTAGTNVTDRESATRFVITYTRGRYTLKSGDYYLYMEEESAAFYLSTSAKYWSYNSNSGYGLGYSISSSGYWPGQSSSSTKYIYYGGDNWGYTSTGGNSNAVLQQVTTKASGTAYTAADFTATVFNRENTATATDGERELTASASTATVEVADYNNDAIHFKISGLTTGSAALYNVSLTLLPLNPEVQTLQVAANVDGKDVGSSEVSSLNYQFFSGDTVKVLVPKDAASPYSIVFRKAENEEKTLWYTSGMNNNSSSSGGYSNYYLVNSPSNSGDYLDLTASDYPSARVNADEAGTEQLLATNIDEVVAGSATELKDNEFSKADAEYKSVSLAAKASKTVYVYSADEPTFQIMPSGTGSKHIDYRYYEITVKPVVENEKPVIAVTPIYSATLKSAPHKQSSSLTSDGSTLDTKHQYVGITVTSEPENKGETAYGVLTNTEIISAIHDALAKQNYCGFTESAPYRGILYVDMSQLTTVAGESTDGVNHWDAFNDATADNCLYFMPEGFNRNVENTIARKGSGFEAVGDIVVADQQPFFTPYSFVTGTRHAKYEREGTVSGSTGTAKALVGNMTAVLPFNVSLTSDGYLKTSSDAVDNSICFHDITGFGQVTNVRPGSGEALTYAMLAQPVAEGIARANQPYYVTSANLGFTFAISGAQFASTADASLTRTAGNWTATGTYSGMQPDKADNLWYFSKDYFWKSGQLQTYSNVNIRPFRAFYTTTANTANSAKATVVFDGSDISDVTGISTVKAESSLLIAAGDGFISLTATSPAQYSICNVAGQVVSRGKMACGEVRNLPLPPGIYMVGGVKVAVR